MGTSNRVLPSSKMNPGSDTNGVDADLAAERAAVRLHATDGALASTAGDAGLVEGNRFKRAVQTAKPAK